LKSHDDLPRIPDLSERCVTSIGHKTGRGCSRSWVVSVFPARSPCASFSSGACTALARCKHRG
jgi:hypothetical protein